jgi:uncharacterized protein (TIGR03437 family)
MNRSWLWIAALGIAATAAAQPRITSIANNASYARAGLQGSGIAQGSIFAVFGENLGPAALVQAGFPLPTNLDGTAIRVTSGTTGVNAFLIYTSARQLAAVLPSNTPIGNATATVTYNGQTSAVFSFNVVARAFGIFTINGAGSGPAVVTDTNFGVVTLTSAIPAGAAASLWGTGSGPVLFADNEAAPVQDLKDQSAIEVFVGNRRANLRFAGRAPGFAGLDQIVFDVPEGLTGCNVSVVVRVAGQISNFTTMAVGSGGRRVCSDPATGFTDADLDRAVAQGNLRTGTIALNRATSKVNVPTIGTIDSNTDSGGAIFYRYDFRSVISRGQVQSSVGNCYVTTFGGQSGFVDPVTFTALDAGAALSITGPRGTKSIPRVPQVAGSYGAQLGGGVSVPLPVPIPGQGDPPYLDPGSYTITGPGGSDVGPFTAQVTVAANFLWTNQDAISTVPRNTDLRVNWTGGGADDLVFISGSSMRSSPDAGASFTCTERASVGFFSVPSIVLSALPASTLTAQGASTSSLSVAQTQGANSARFTASGLDLGLATHSTFHFKNVTYQ